MSDRANGAAGAPASDAGLDRPDLRGPAVIIGSIGLAAGVLGTAIVVTHGPTVRRWWSAQVVPAVSAATRRVLRRDGLDDEAPSDSSVILTRSTLRSFSRRVSAAVENAASNSVGGTAGRRELDLIELLLAASIIADRMRTRSEADLEAESHLPELSAAMDRLASRSVVDAVNRALSAPQSPIDDETRVIFSRVFDGGRLDAGVYVPVRIERVESALRITRSVIPVPRTADGPADGYRHRS